MAEILKLPKRKFGRAAAYSAAAPEEIVYLEFRGAKTKQIRFAAGSMRAKMFDRLERLIAEQAPIGQLLKFLRDKADVHVELLLRLVRWLEDIDVQAITQEGADEIIRVLGQNPKQNIKVIAQHEEKIWKRWTVKWRQKKHGTPNIELFKTSYETSFNVSTAFRAAVFERLWQLVLVILSAYRQSVDPQRPSLWQRGRLLFLRIFAPTKWAREIR